MPVRLTYMAQRVIQGHEPLFKSMTEEMAARVSVYREANAEVVNQVARIYAEAGERTLTYQELSKAHRLEGLHEQLVKMGKDLGADEDSFATNAFTDAYTGAGQQVAEQIGLEWGRISQEQVDKVLSYPWSGKNFSERIWDNTSRLVDSLRETIVRGSVQGSSFTDMATTINDIFGGAYRDSERLVRTEGMFFINQGQLDMYKDNGIERVAFCAIEDDVTCEDCTDLDGEEYDLGDEEVLPIHPNCRCTYIPVVTDEQMQQDMADNIGETPETVFAPE